MDRIIVLDKGLIVVEETHHDRIHTPDRLYKKLWTLQKV